MSFVRPLVHLVALALGAWIFSREPREFAAMVGPAMDRTLWFGLFATLFLYLALLPGPLYAAFPALPLRKVWTQARRALGIDSAVFAGFHGWYGFYGWVGGFEGLSSWSWDYNLSLLLGTVAFAILVVLALTSFDVAANALGRGWKRLHRFVYAAGVLVVAHAASVTIHILDLKPLLVAWFVALTFLLLVELLRVRPKLIGKMRAAVIAGFALSVAALFWSTFLISHHRH